MIASPLSQHELAASGFIAELRRFMSCCWRCHPLPVALLPFMPNGSKVQKHRRPVSSYGPPLRKVFRRLGSTHCCETRMPGSRDVVPACQDFSPA